MSVLIFQTGGTDAHVEDLESWSYEDEKADENKSIRNIQLVCRYLSYSTIHGREGGEIPDCILSRLSLSGEIHGVEISRVLAMQRSSYCVTCCLSAKSPDVL